MLCLSGFELYSRWVPLKEQSGTVLNIGYRWFFVVVNEKLYGSKQNKV